MEEQQWRARVSNLEFQLNFVAGKLGELQGIVFEQNNFIMDILKKEGF